MSEKYKRRYRIESARLKYWDYSSPGYYFVTICARDRKKFFGYIDNGKMILNQVGEIIYGDWLNIPRRHENVYLDEFVIMPNHIHGIIIINGTQYLPMGDNVETLRATSLQKPPQKPKSTQNNNQMSKISPKSKSLSTVVRSYKSGCSNQIHKLQNSHYFGWQSRFHDHIIRNDQALNNIRRYIKNNPAKWWRDRNN